MKRKPWRVVVGDCVRLMRTEAEAGRLYKLVFGDPPFNIDQSYENYRDNLEWDDYVAWTGGWVDAAVGILAPGGVLCLHGPDTLAELYLQAGNRYRKKLKRIAWVNWHYRFAQNNKRNWGDSRCHCLIYARAGAPHTWNPETVLVPSDRASKYKDKRATPTTVVNKHYEEYDVDICRPGKWGNPFRIGHNGDRGEVIAKYAEWVVQQPHLMQAIGELRGNRLGCVCKPSRCHGDILVGLANDKYEGGGMRLPFTIWGLPEDGPNWGRVQGNNAERVPERPNQLPEVYLERLLKAYTNKGDYVFDTFCGTGTTITVAKAMGRYCTTVDIDPAAAKATMDRLKRGAIRV